MTSFKDKLRRFMPIAEAFANMSKDPSTKVGALVLGPEFEVRAQGWNGAPRRCSADTDERYATREEKLWWAAHAEENAIANAARSGASTNGCSLVVTHAPCMRCARLIVQSGIMTVLCPKPEEAFMARWSEDVQRSQQLFRECSVRLIWL